MRLKPFSGEKKSWLQLKKSDSTLQFAGEHKFLIFFEWNEKWPICLKLQTLRGLNLVFLSTQVFLYRYFYDFNASYSQSDFLLTQKPVSQCVFVLLNFLVLFSASATELLVFDSSGLTNSHLVFRRLRHLKINQPPQNGQPANARPAPGEYLSVIFSAT